MLRIPDLTVFVQMTSPNSLLSFAPILVIFAIFYFLLFMPMQRQKKAQQKLLTELKNGDVVTTTGGIVGTIVSIEGELLTLRIKPDNIKLQFARAAISGLALTETGKQA